MKTVTIEFPELVQRFTSGEIRVVSKPSSARFSNRITVSLTVTAEEAAALHKNQNEIIKRWSLRCESKNVESYIRGHLRMRCRLFAVVVRSGCATINVGGTSRRFLPGEAKDIFRVLKSCPQIKITVL